MWNVEFWKAAAERAIKTVLQTLVAMGVGDKIGLLTIDWWHVLSVAGMAGLFSLITSIGSDTVKGQPSLNGAEQLTVPDIGEVPASHIAKRVLDDDEAAGDAS